MARKDCDNCQWDDDGIFYRDNKYGFDPCVNCTQKYNEPPSNWKLKQITISDVDYDYDGYLESDIVVRDYTEDNGFCHLGIKEGDDNNDK